MGLYDSIERKIKKDWSVLERARTSVLVIALVAFGAGAYAGFRASDYVLRERIANLESLVDKQQRPTAPSGAERRARLRLILESPRLIPGKPILLNVSYENSGDVAATDITREDFIGFVTVLNRDGSANTELMRNVETQTFSGLYRRLDKKDPMAGAINPRVSPPSFYTLTGPSLLSTDFVAATADKAPAVRRQDQMILIAGVLRYKSEGKTFRNEHCQYLQNHRVTWHCRTGHNSED